MFLARETNCFSDKKQFVTSGEKYPTIFQAIKFQNLKFSNYGILTIEFLI